MNIWLVAVLAALAGVFAEGLILHYLLPLLQESAATRKNYQGWDIPVSAGISFPLALLLVYTIILLFAPLYEQPVNREIYFLFLMGIFAISLLGFADDMLGQRDTLGFKGHLGALLHGRMTTGGLKAAGGALIALFLALSLSSGLVSGWPDIIVDTLIMALFANMLNLLDLRPGRALKGFFFFFFLLAFMASWKINWILIAPLLGATLYYVHFDLKALAMMGDSGSNVLGLALGFIAAGSLPLSFKVGALFFLIFMHLITEKYSLTQIIEKVAILRKIDQWGRGKSDGKSEKTG